MASRGILALRAELDEQTKEIQKLQKEVERATEHTINQLSLPQNCQRPTPSGCDTTARLLCASSAARGSQDLLSSVTSQVLTSKSPLHGSQEGVIATRCNGMQSGLDGTSCLADKYSVKPSPTDYSSLLSDACRRSEEDRATHVPQLHPLRQSTTELNTKVLELMKKNTELGLWCNESKSQDGAIKQLEDKIQELETAKVVQEEMLKQAHAYIDILKEMLQKRDLVHQDIQKAILAYIDPSGKELQSGFDFSNLGTILMKVFHELADEVSSLKAKLQTTEEKINFINNELEIKEKSLKQCQERCSDFVKEHDQEVAALTLEMNSARDHGKTMQDELEAVQKQNKKYEEHTANLESVASQLRSELKNCKKCYKEKVEELRHQLSVTNTALEEAHSEQSRATQDFSNQLTQLNEALKMCEKQLDLEKEKNKKLQDHENAGKVANEHLRRELIERAMEVERLQVLANVMKEDSRQMEAQQVKIIQEKMKHLNFTTGQLESMKRSLQKVTEDLAAKTQSLEHSENSVKELKAHLAEKEKTLKNAVDELRKLRSYAEAKKKEVLQLKTVLEQTSQMLEDTETLNLLLIEKDNMIKTLREQVETLTQVVGHQNQKIGSLEAERCQLIEEASLMNDIIQYNKVMAENNDIKICELEDACSILNMEKAKLTDECIEKSHAAKKLRKEKEEIIAELKETQSEFACLTENYESLKRKCESWNREDKENATAILKMQLQATIAELVGTKNTLKTVEDCDGHAIKIATRMQKKITAKREQIDTLQSRIHFLEEALNNATKDKKHLKVEKAKLMQKCASEAAEKNKLSDAMQTFKSENLALKGQVANKEAALDKTMLQLSECQAVIQHLEQEIMCLRLQHTLDLKELKVPVSSKTCAKPTYIMASSSFPISTDVHVPQYQLLVRSCPKVSMFAEPSVQDNIVEPSEEAIYLSDSVACLPFKDEAPLKLSKMDHTPPAQISKIDLTRDSMEPISRLDSFSREPLTLHTADLEEKKHSLLTTDSEIQTLERPYYASSPKYFGSQERKARSPVHSLLTAPLCDTHVDGTAESHHFLGENCSDSFAHEVPNDSRQDLQHRLEYLQRFAEDLEMKNKEMLLLMRNYGKADTEIDKLKCSDQIKPA